MTPFPSGDGGDFDSSRRGRSSPSSLPYFSRGFYSSGDLGDLGDIKIKIYAEKTPSYPPLRLPLSMEPERYIWGLIIYVLASNRLHRLHGLLLSLFKPLHPETIETTLSDRLRRPVASCPNPLTLQHINT
jgi:hypothetical protein